MFKNKLKEKLLTGEVCYGTIVASNAPDTVEIIGLLGFDFLLIDGEHGYMSPETCLPLIRTAESTGMTPLVRICENNEALVLRTLDIGAYGIHIPQINSKDDACKAIQAIKYFPEGMRGVSFHRASGYGIHNINTYMETENKETLTIFHCENVKCLENLDEIVSTKGLDVMIYGPFDMSQSMEIPGQVTNPKVEAGAQQMLEACKKHGKIAGIYCGTVEAAKERIKQGFTYILIGVDCSVIANAYSNIINGLRS